MDEGITKQTDRLYGTFCDIGARALRQQQHGDPGGRRCTLSHHGYLPLVTGSVGSPRTEPKPHRSTRTRNSRQSFYSARTEPLHFSSSANGDALQRKRKCTSAVERTAEVNCSPSGRRGWPAKGDASLHNASRYCPSANTQITPPCGTTVLTPMILLIRPCWTGWIDAPAGLHRDVLHAVHLIGRRRRDDPRVGLELPELLAGPRVERPEHAIVGAAVEHQPAGRGQDRAPVHRADRDASSPSCRC